MLNNSLKTRLLTTDEMYFKKPVRLFIPLPSSPIHTPSRIADIPRTPLTVPVESLPPVDVSKPQLNGPSIKQEAKMFTRNFGPMILIFAVIVAGGLIYLYLNKKAKIQEEEENNFN